MALHPYPAGVWTISIDSARIIRLRLPGNVRVRILRPEARLPTNANFSARAHIHTTRHPVFWQRMQCPSAPVRMQASFEHAWSGLTRPNVRACASPDVSFPTSYRRSKGVRIPETLTPGVRIRHGLGYPSPGRCLAVRWLETLGGVSVPRKCDPMRQGDRDASTSRRWPSQLPPAEPVA